jgi:hypothetical protein
LSWHSGKTGRHLPPFKPKTRSLKTQNTPIQNQKATDLEQEGMKCETFGKTTMEE